MGREKIIFLPSIDSFKELSVNEFIQDTQLPMSRFVSSGNYIHVRPRRIKKNLTGFSYSHLSPMMKYLR